MAEGRLWYMEEGIEIGKVGLPWPSIMQGTWGQSLVEELRFHMLQGMTKKEKLIIK